MPVLVSPLKADGAERDEDGDEDDDEEGDVVLWRCVASPRKPSVTHVISERKRS